MDREHALERLAPVYARALRLAEQGSSESDIAAELGIDTAAVASLLEIGAGKLARAMAEEHPPAEER